MNYKAAMHGLERVTVVIDKIRNLSTADRIVVGNYRSDTSMIVLEDPSDEQPSKNHVDNQESA